MLCKPKLKRKTKSISSISENLDFTEMSVTIQRTDGRERPFTFFGKNHGDVFTVRYILW